MLLAGGGQPNTRTVTLRPVNPDEMICVWYSPASGTFEWICGPHVADELLNGGMRTINGQPCRVEVVDRHPQLGGIQVRATTSGPVPC